MAFAGGIGARIELGDVPADIDDDNGTGNADRDRDLVLLFSESNTRFLCEVPPDRVKEFENKLAGVPHACIGKTLPTDRLEIFSAAGGADLIDRPLDELKAAWKSPLAW
jgi:phosphoribosylformylglycinamidine synthase